MATQNITKIAPQKSVEEQNKKHDSDYLAGLSQKADASGFFPDASSIIRIAKDINTSMIHLEMCSERNMATCKTDEDYRIRAYEETIIARKLMRHFLSLTDPIDGPNAKPLETEPDVMAQAKDHKLEAEEDEEAS